MCRSNAELLAETAGEIRGVAEPAAVRYLGNSQVALPTQKRRRIFEPVIEDKGIRSHAGETLELIVEQRTRQPQLQAKTLISRFWSLICTSI